MLIQLWIATLYFMQKVSRCCNSFTNAGILSNEIFSFAFCAEQICVPLNKKHKTSRKIILEFMLVMVYN